MSSEITQSQVTHIVALSGGKDSTAMALWLAEHEPRPYVYLITPTGDELPEMLAHWERLECLLGTPMTRLTNGTLKSWSEEFSALPNFRQRWCTRLLKIEPAIRFCKEHLPAIAYVGLRADEDADVRKGIYGTDVEQRFPLRELGWGIREVQAYLRQRGVSIPKRTDCARCYGQRLGEWENLYFDYPEIYASAAAEEEATGHTYRSPQRDSQPARLADLAKVFQARGRQLVLMDDDIDSVDRGCRVCKL